MYSIETSLKFDFPVHPIDYLSKNSGLNVSKLDE